MSIELQEVSEIMKMRFYTGMINMAAKTAITTFTQYITYGCETSYISDAVEPILPKVGSEG